MLQPLSISLSISLGMLVLLGQMCQRSGGSSVSSSPSCAYGRRGGDLLFHEVCEELGIERQLYFVIPREAYVKLGRPLQLAGNGPMSYLSAVRGAADTISGQEGLRRLAVVDCLDALQSARARRSQYDSNSPLGRRESMPWAS